MERPAIARALPPWQPAVTTHPRLNASPVVPWVEVMQPEYVNRRRVEVARKASRDLKSERLSRCLRNKK
jgi:hypothetical protein